VITGLIVFEDGRWHDLSPLSDLTPLPRLAFGASDLATRWQRATNLPILAIEARTGWAGGSTRLGEGPPRGGPHEPPAAHRSGDGAASTLLPPPTPSAAGEDQVLAVNAAALPGPWLAELTQHSEAALFTCGGRRVAARLTRAAVTRGLGRGERFDPFLASLELPVKPVDTRIIAWPWQLIDWNPQALGDDLARARAKVRGELHPSATVYEPARVTIEVGARVDAGAVLDAREGPIHIATEAIVQSHTLVIGPCVVGAGTHLLGGVIAHSTIGPGCRIAGEVDACVWQGWANKRHHGFVGHSWIGEWANLGALTTTSDLKNNYGTIRVQVGSRELDSGLIKLGSILGAGVKTGIGTLLPSGAMIGTGSHLFGGGHYAPKRLPAFSWWDGERAVEYQLEKFLATARTAMGRRGRELSGAEEETLRTLFASTAGEREQAQRVT
jgi:UDP-N-acetylglucosamine diphosphorylase/glucosamine-1-phosphate N-acetyltransferase